jgi:hypothetical protein
VVIVYLVILVALAGVPLAMTIQRPVRIFEYPFFMAFAFAVFIVPQAFSLIRFSGDVEDSSVDAVLLMSCLCLTACFVGYRLPLGSMTMRWTTRAVDLKRLFQVGLVFIAISYAAGSLLSITDVQYADRGGMTGSATIILFFYELAYPGFAIALFCWFRRRSVARLAAVIAGTIPMLFSLAAGRRENAAMLVLTIAMAFFYERRTQPPRLAIVAILVFSMLAIPSTGQYREYAVDSNWVGALQIDLVGNFQHFLSGDAILELRNGAAVIESTSKTGHYDYGAAYWNQLVFRYVPAQLLGSDFKQALMLDSWDLTRNSATETGIPLPRGSTITGMGDTFQQFGWFGCVFFALMAVPFKSLWKASLAKEAIFARLLYVLTLTSGMRAVTHWTVDFLPGFLYVIIFLGAAALYANVPAARRLRTSTGFGGERIDARIG